MLNKVAISQQMSDELYDYVLDNNHEPEVLQQVRESTYGMSGASMQISPEQGRFMGWLVEALQVKKAIEVGVFTGYSSLVVALALPDDGKLFAIDMDVNSMEIARGFWKQAGVSYKISERLGKGTLELERLLKENGEGSFDFAFIDADKRSYDNYYELLLRLVRTGGTIVVDNTLWSGKILDPEVQDKATIAIRELNRKITQDERVSATMIQIGDGLTLCRKI